MTTLQIFLLIELQLLIINRKDALFVGDTVWLNVPSHLKCYRMIIYPLLIALKQELLIVYMNFFKD